MRRKMAVEHELYYRRYFLSNFKSSFIVHDRGYHKRAIPEHCQRMQPKSRKLWNKISKSTVVFTWLFVRSIAIFPVMFRQYFNTNYVTFYGQNSVYLPLQLPDESRKVFGWEYCFGLFGVLNALMCLYVTTLRLTILLV